MDRLFRITIVFLWTIISGSTAIDHSNYVKCEDPGTPRNGYRYVYGREGFLVGSGVSFWCRVGCRLSGEQRLFCVHNNVHSSVAVWSSRSPQCVPSALLSLKRGTGCPDNGNPENGFRVLNGTSEGAAVTFGCNLGFILIGNTRLTCSEGRWSGDWPLCTRVVDKAICGDPGSIFYAFGTRFVEGTMEGSNVTYSCAQGLALIGDAVRTCLPSGEWSGSVPICRVVNCGQPPPTPNGTVQYENLGFGFTATYSCNRGHVLEGRREVTCLKNNSWSTPPTCRAVRCPRLSNPANGTVLQSRNAMYLDEAVYLCDNQFGVVGLDTRVCMANGSWSGEAPVCVSGQCDELQNPPNGLVHYDSVSVNSIAIYTCDNCYRLLGQVTRMCQATGRWSNSSPSCEPSVCPDIIVPLFGSVLQTNGNYVFSVATHACSVGYSLLGNEERVCSPNGIWSGSPPVCKVIQCPDLAVPSNGNYSLTDRRCFKSEAWYRCNEGYTLYGGDMIRTCQDSGQWSGVQPVCVIQWEGPGVTTPTPADSTTSGEDVSSVFTISNKSTSQAGQYTCTATLTGATPVTASVDITVTVNKTMSTSTPSSPQRTFDNIAAIIGGVLAFILIIAITIVVSIIVFLMFKIHGDSRELKHGVNFSEVEGLAITTLPNEAYEQMKQRSGGRREEGAAITTFPNEAYAQMKQRGRKEEGAAITTFPNEAYAQMKQRGRKEEGAAITTFPNAAYEQMQQRGRKEEGAAITTFPNAAYEQMQQRGRKEEGAAITTFPNAVYELMQQRGRKEEGAAITTFPNAAYEQMQETDPQYQVFGPPPVAASNLRI